MTLRSGIGALIRFLGPLIRTLGSLIRTLGFLIRTLRSLIRTLGPLIWAVRADIRGIVGVISLIWALRAVWTVALWAIAVVGPLRSLVRVVRALWPLGAKVGVIALRGTGVKVARAMRVGLQRIRAKAVGAVGALLDAENQQDEVGA